MGKTLTRLNLRAVTGAMVLVIVRGDEGRPPTAEQTLAVGDVLALAGTHEALASARRLLTGGP